MLKPFVTAVAVAALAAPSVARAATWELDPAHSSAGFQVRHMMVSNVRGEFTKLTGVVQLNDNEVGRSAVEATIESASINTREPKRDAHLRSPDFFDVAQFPTITFKSKKVEKVADGRFQVTGDLSLHGVTRPVTLDVQAPSEEARDGMGKLHRGITATTRISRKEFGLKWNMPLETGGVVVGDEVAITIEAELVSNPVAG